MPVVISGQLGIVMQVLIDNDFFNNGLQKVINIAPYSVQKSSKAHPA
jgi:hypothetical protein